MRPHQIQKMAYHPGAAPGIAGFGDLRARWCAACFDFLGEANHTAGGIESRPYSSRPALLPQETNPVVFSFESLLASGGANTALGNIRHGGQRPDLEMRSTMTGDRLGSASLLKIKNEHRCLILMTQPQDFSTDVSVFCRHTSQGKPLGDFRFWFSNSSFERLFFYIDKSKV
jgi:hypothetical protein